MKFPVGYNQPLFSENPYGGKFIVAISEKPRRVIRAMCR